MPGSNCVVIESPYAGDVEYNVKYARKCLKDSLSRGEAPFASHLLYTQVLDDLVPVEREQGINGQLSFLDLTKKTVVYNDRGISRGMQAAIDYATSKGYSVEYRSLGKED